MTEQQRVVIIGAGLAGLAAGLTLRGAGHEVTIVERTATPGGLVRTETLGADTADGLPPEGSEIGRFDTGATVLTMPELIIETLGAVGIEQDEARRRLRLGVVDPTYHARFADHTDLRVAHDPQRLRAEIAERMGTDAARGAGRLLDWLDRLYDAEFDSFIATNFDDPRILADRRLRTDAIELIRMGALRHLSGAVGRFVDDERLQRVFTFQSLYAGMPPSRAAAIYGVIAAMDIGRGVTYPEGGMGRIGAVMAEAFVEAGGILHYRSTVRHVARSGRRVTAVDIVDEDGATTHLGATAVIATPPPPRVAELLGEPLPRGPRWRRIRHSPSAVVIHGVVPAAVSSDWPGHHHTIDFGEQWAQTFLDITRRPGRLMADPSFLITRPAFSDPQNFRTATTESVSVLAPCPNLSTADLPWGALARPYVTECLQILDARGYRGIERSLQILRVDTPHTWAAAGLPAGTPFGAAHSLTQTGPLRTPNRWQGIDNLFLAGSSTIPGVGIPPVLVSGQLAARRVLAEAS